MVNRLKILFNLLLQCGAYCLLILCTRLSTFLYRQDSRIKGWLVRLQGPGRPGRFNMERVQVSRVRAFMDELDRLDDETLEALRSLMERSSIFPAVRRGAANQRVYAVLMPSRAENLERIENIVQVIPEGQFPYITQQARQLAHFYQANKDILGGLRG